MPEHQQQQQPGDENPQSRDITKPRVAFISGPLDADDEYFNSHYKPAIDAAVAAGHHFIIGPVRGIDAMALRYLVSTGIPRNHITVYMAHYEYLTDSWRKSFLQQGVNVKHVEDAIITLERDEAMTRDSDYDILRYRGEKEAKVFYGTLWRERVSNTEMNERRRRGITSTVYGLVIDEEGEKGRR